MNGSHKNEHEQSYVKDRDNLPQIIQNTLQTKASQIHFTGAQRQQIIQHITKPQERARKQRLLLPALGLIAILLLISITTITLSQSTHQPSIASGQVSIYSIKQISNVAPELADGGQLLSVDPTEQHIVYQPAHQSGVLYVANIADPLRTNIHAMDNAQDMAWSQDGTKLVATVTPEGEKSSVLALVPVGQYMHTLGQSALAANWSPTDPGKILYVTQSNGQTQLWETDSTGQLHQYQGTIAIPQMVQHMQWSPNGEYLLFVTADTGTVIDGQESRSIYIMNTRKKAVQQIIEPGTFQIGAVSWSPDSNYLSYEQIEKDGSIKLASIDIQQPEKNFQIAPQHPLQGWSWSPDSRELVYSNDGILYEHLVQTDKEESISPKNMNLISPFWLKDGSILCMQLDHQNGKMAILTASKHNK